MLGQPGGVFIQAQREFTDLFPVDQHQLVATAVQQMTVMRNDDHGAVKVLQRLGQGFTHFKVEVVGRLVEQQQVGLLVDQHGQHQAGFLATGEVLDFCQRHIIGKAEAAEVVAQLCFARLIVQLL